MSLIETAAELFKQHLGESGSNLDVSSIVSALSGLLKTENGELDLGALLSQVQSGDLADMAASWLGNGGNAPMSVDNIMNLFGDDQLNDFASQLNIGKTEAADGLSGMIPKLIDAKSEDGNLAGIASGILGKLF